MFQLSSFAWDSLESSRSWECHILHLISFVNPKPQGFQLYFWNGYPWEKGEAKRDAKSKGKFIPRSSTEPSGVSLSYIPDINSKLYKASNILMDEEQKLIYYNVSVQPSTFKRMNWHTHTHNTKILTKGLINECWFQKNVHNCEVLAISKYLRNFKSLVCKLCFYIYKCDKMVI